MQAAKAKPSSNKGSNANFCHAPISTMSTIFKFQIKLIIGGADQTSQPACIFSSKVLKNQIPKFMTVELFGSFSKFLSCYELWCLVLEHF